MRVFDLVRKDIRQILRDWKSAVFLVVMPILFTLFFGLVLGPVLSPAPKGDSRLPIGIIDGDPGGTLSAGLLEMLAASEVVRPVALTGADANRAAEAVAKAELAAVVSIPRDYGQHVLADQPASLMVFADSNTAAGRTATTAIEAAVTRLLGAVESAHLSAEAYQERIGFQNEAARQAYLASGLAQALAAWQDPPLQVRVTVAAGTESDSGSPAPMSGFVQSSSGMIVQFAVFGLITSAMVLVLERKTGALQRLLTTPMTRVEIIGGHALAMFLVVFVQELILVGLGQFAFGVEYLRQPWAVLVVMAALALWAASLGLLIGAISKKEDQVIVLSLIAMFLFSALGGAWFPLEVTGKTFAAVGHLMPTAWAIDGLQNISLRGLGFGSVLAPAGMLLAYALAFFALAVWRFKFE